MTPERLAEIHWYYDQHVAQGRGDALRGELIEALEAERARLDWLATSRVNYIRRGNDGVRLIETDCGAMICYGDGADLRAAIDSARGARIDPERGLPSREARATG